MNIIFGVQMLNKVHQITLKSNDKILLSKPIWFGYVIKYIARQLL